MSELLNFFCFPIRQGSNGRRAEGQGSFGAQCSEVSSLTAVWGTPGNIIGDELGRQEEISLEGLSCHATEPGLHAMTYSHTRV